MIFVDIECFEEFWGIKSKDCGCPCHEKRKGKQQTLNQMMKQKQSMNRDIWRVIYGHALAFTLVKSPFIYKDV